MIYVGLTKGIINATAHWYLAVTEDGTTFKNEDKDTLKEVLKCVEEMQKDTLKEVAICFDHWGASSWIAEIAEFVSKHEHLHLELTKVDITPCILIIRASTWKGTIDSIQIILGTMI